jgi:hypothetical protein
MKCWECEIETNEIHDHHPVPQSRGGTKTIPLCGGCHAKAHHMDKNMTTSVLTKEALDKRKALKQGRYFCGRSPYGFEAVSGSLQVKANEWVNIVRWFKMKRAGLSQRTIANVFDKDQTFIARIFKRHKNIQGLVEYTIKEVPSLDITAVTKLAHDILVY